jgi:hypothetical protein
VPTLSTSKFDAAEASLYAVFELSVCAQDRYLFSAFCTVWHYLEAVLHLNSLDVVH